MEMIYCPICGHLLNKKEIGDEGIVPYCNCCNRPIFNIAYPCVILLVENEYQEICIIKQSYGNCELPVLIAGFVKMGSDVEQTIQSEVAQEIGHVVLDFKFIHSYFHKRGGNLMLGFICHVKKGLFKKSLEIKEAMWQSYAEAKESLKNSAIALKLLNKYLEEQDD